MTTPATPPMRPASLPVSAYRPPARIAGALLVTSPILMLAGAAVVVGSGLTLNPADTAATLAAVESQVGLHLTELGLDVISWLALTVAGLLLAARSHVTGSALAATAAGLFAATGLAGLLHDAGNLAVTQLASDAADPATLAAARALLLTAKWTVNLAGLLWACATATAALGLAPTSGLRRGGLLAAACGFGAAVLPWSTGTAGPSPAIEQIGYVLQVPVLIWIAVLGLRLLRTPEGQPRKIV